MANDEHVAMLRRDVDEWNRWRDENPQIIPNLGGADLINMDLSGADLSNVNLASADLRGTNLQLAYLSGATLENADLQSAGAGRADLTRANLRKAKLADTDLADAKLSGAVLDGADLRSAKLRQADLTNASLVNSKLNKAVLVGTRLIGVVALDADFGRANLDSAKLSNADIRGAYLGGADMRGAELDNANLDGVNLRRAFNLDCAGLQVAKNWISALRDPQLACGEAIPESGNRSAKFSSSDAEPDSGDISVSPGTAEITIESGTPTLSVVAGVGMEAEVIPGPAFQIVVRPEDRILIAEPGSRAARRPDDMSDKDFQERLAEAAKALRDVETALETAIPADSMIGHNRPPEDAFVVPMDDTFRRQLLATVRSGIQEFEAPYADAGRLKQIYAWLGRVALELQPYSKMAMEEASKTFGKTMGVLPYTLIVAGAAQLLGLIDAAIQSFKGLFM